MDEVERQIVKIFWDADHNKSGSISMRELYDMLNKNGYSMTYEKFQENFASFDENGDNEISLHEYLKGMGRPASEYKRYEVYQKLFRKFDKSGNGYLRKTEVSDGIRNVGTDISDDLVNVLFTMMDKRKSGQVEYDEFINFFFGVEIP